MRNWIRTAVISAVVALSGGAAWGFDANEIGRLYYINNGVCVITTEVDTSNQYAYVAVRRAGTYDVRLTDGSYWQGGIRQTAPIVDAAHLASCLGTYPQNVTNLMGL